MIKIDLFHLFLVIRLIVIQKIKLNLFKITKIKIQLKVILNSHFLQKNRVFTHYKIDFKMINISNKKKSSILKVHNLNKI